MGSSHYIPSYDQWDSPYSSHPPPPLPLLPPPLPPPHPESPNFYVSSSHNGEQRKDYLHYSHPPKPAVNQPSSYYVQQPPEQHLQYVSQQVSYDSQRVSQPSSWAIPCTESRDISQSTWVGYKDQRLDSWTVDAAQGRMDTSRSRVDRSPGRNHQYDGSSRSRDEFRNVGHARKESGATRIERNHQDRGQLKAEFDRCYKGLDERYRTLSSRVGYGSERYGVELSLDMSRSSAHNGGRILYPRKRDDYYHLDRGRSIESNRTPGNQTQKKSALLRLEIPRNHQNARENARNCSSYSGRKFNSNSFSGKEHLSHSDRGLVEKKRGRTPVDLDVSFESNRLVAKPVALSTSAGIHPCRSVTPRSSKAGRALVPDKSEKAEGNGKLRAHVSDEALVSEGDRQSTRQNTASEIEKKPDNHSTPSSSDARGRNKVSFVIRVVQNSKVKVIDRGPGTSTNGSEPKVRSAVHAAENVSSFCQALEKAKDDSIVEHASKMEVCSTEEDVIDGNKNILKSHEDLLDRTGTCCKAILPKGVEMENNVKTKTNTSPKKLVISWSTVADLSGSSEARIRFAGMSMCSVGSQPCEDMDMDCLPSRNLPVMDVNAGFKERKVMGSSVGSLGYVDKDLGKSSVDASNHFNSEDPGDHVLAKSDSGGIEDNSKVIHKNVDSFSPENDSRRGLPKVPVFSASLDIPNVSTELANANNNVSGDLANARSFTVGTFTNTMVKSPDMSESKNPTHCEITVNPLVENENVSRTESMETTYLSSAAEMADNRDNDKGKKACVKGTWSSLTKVDVKESSVVLPVERTDGCSGSDESGLAMAVPSEVCIENLSAERLVPDEDLGITSHHPAEIMHEENNCAENIDVDVQEEKTNPFGRTLNYKTPGTDVVAVTGDSVFPCNSVSSSPGRSFRQIRSEIHVAAAADEICKDKPKPKHSGGTNKYRTRGTNIFAFSGDSLSNSPRLYRQIRSEVHVASRVDDTNNYKEKAKPSGGTSKCRTPEADVTSDVGGQEKFLLNRAKTDIFDGEAWSSVVNVSGTEILGDSGVRLSRAHSHADRDSQSKTSLSSRYEIDDRKKKSNYSTQKRYSRALPFVSDTKKDDNPPNKRHTWHRKPDTSASPFVATKPLSSTLFTQPKVPIVTAQSSRSYVRKGNSLLRKPSHGSPGVTRGLPPSAIQLNRIEDKSTGSASRVDVVKASFLVKTGEITTLERQSNPRSDGSTSKISNGIVSSSGKCPLSYSRDHLITGLPESVMDSQLIAASDIHGTTKGQIPTSDGFFKRSKNQLVRTLASCVNHSPDDALDSRAVTTMVSKRLSSSAFSDSGMKAFTRPYKRSKFSLVWTQNDTQSGLGTSHMRYQRILPQLIPWKRVTYWRRQMKSVSALRNGSFSNSSQKLSMMRKRRTVYTRSTNGYSLRKSKVLSIGGSHLKWSKSIERDARKANEEATLAVAEFSKKESEKHSGQSSTRKTSRNHLARERVFRIGSSRYKMDSSRRTLQRISDDDLPCSGPTENGKGSKRLFIPKRLVIGNEEYVRVGNGNQLVRDPKKRTRALANEKVRWSLHNVRLRLAKKKKYCQFFTRFGKCNTADGKCRYVHDPSKIAVCTKFLNGLCANANCKLTHKVIPERMPDCSYFLQGLCNNEACPYRHVHVNPSAAICDGFLKGYCSDGDECRKKHSYTCPVFEATGSCSQGSKCKLHHPKSQSKGSKRKRPSEASEKNSRGRYFGSLHKVFSEAMVVDRHSTNSADFGIQGLDFIFIGATEYEAGDNNDPAAEESVSSASEEPVSIYNLIRPVALMQ